MSAPRSKCCGSTASLGITEDPVSVTKGVIFVEETLKRTFWTYP